MQTIAVVEGRLGWRLEDDGQPVGEYLSRETAFKHALDHSSRSFARGRPSQVVLRPLPAPPTSH